LYSGHTLPIFVLAALYIGLLTAVAGESKRMLRRSIAVRRERDEMVHKLERSNGACAEFCVNGVWVTAEEVVPRIGS
jgi:hypothetical protein